MSRRDEAGGRNMSGERKKERRHVRSRFTEETLACTVDAEDEKKEDEK